MIQGGVTGKQTASFNNKKTFLFKLMACCIPLILIILLELTLRLAGYGHSINLFVTDPTDESALVMNQYASEKFFSNSANATIGNTEKFKKQKQPGTLRFFVLGESTTIGYPYMHNAAFHRLLQYRLMLEYPQTNIELINLSLTAVNSHTVLDFAKTIVNYSPDAVLIYCGHNEYYGAMGAASTNVLNGNPLFIRLLFALKGCRSWQLLNNGLAGITGSRKQTLQNESLMQRMAANQQVAYGTPVFNKGIEQFRQNMEAVCKLLSANNIPVFISNLVSNEKDLEPFISSNDSLSAKTSYQQGQQYYKDKQFELAKTYFTQAKEQDLLRFRAPEQINAVIEATCSKYSNTFLVDTRSLFEENSKGGILGRETMLEHVHPNLFGYALLSDAFYNALRRQHIPAATPLYTMNFEDLYNSMPVTSVDSIKGAFEIAALKMHWPFNDTTRLLPVNSFEERLASQLLTKQISWNTMLDTLMPYYAKQGDYTQALKVAVAALLEHPDEPTFYLFAAAYSKRLRHVAQSSAYLQKAFQLRPSVDLAKQLVDLLLETDQPEASLPYVDYLIRNNPAASYMIAVKKMLFEMVLARKKIATAFSTSLAREIAAVYTRLGYDSIAQKYSRMSLTNNPLSSK